MGFVLDAWLTPLVYGWFHKPMWMAWMSGLTHLGDTGVVLAAALLAAVESASVRIRRGRSAAPLLVWLGIPISGGAALWIKEVVGRPRPWQVYPAWETVPEGMNRSFPSGHAVVAFALAAALALRWPKVRWLVFGLAAAVAVSRVALGLHWMSDVVAGAVLGVSVVLLLNRLEKGR